MAITGIGYGRTFVYETQKRVNEGVLQSTRQMRKIVLRKIWRLRRKMTRHWRR